MPTAHYRNASQGVERQRIVFRTPKNIQSPEAWVGAIRKACPEVPNVRDTDWTIQVFDPSLELILIELRNSIGEHCRIAVDRKSESMAA